MEQGASIRPVRTLMVEFGDRTGLTSTGGARQRYLWTDAFAVCNFLELHRQTEEERYLELALRLVEHAHHVLGRHRSDDPRSGWISGLGEEDGRQHPTARGLRIGKKRNERGPDEPFDPIQEWDRDGQYYHYLTKWMHALCRVSRVTEDPTFLRWARELAKAAHAQFTYAPRFGGPKRMHWKMSIDLTRPLVPSMGQHDPLDGLITYVELQSARVGEGEESAGPNLGAELAEMSELCRGGSWTTEDPLGIGGLLFDANRLAQLMSAGFFEHSDLLEAILNAALSGLESWTRSQAMKLPADHRLAFRELGLSIGLKAAGKMRARIQDHPSIFGAPVDRRAEALLRYAGLSEQIEGFWLEDRNRSAATWTEHRDINDVMLATSLAPEGFLAL